MSSDERGEQPGLIGADVERAEDARMITGQAEYLDDLIETRAAEVTILRSQHAHARINDVDTGDAEARDGVLAVITAEDMEAADLPTPDRIPIVPGPGVGYPPEEFNRTALADGKVRYQGEAIAVVVAEDRNTAHDALDDVHVDYERLEAAVELDDALAEGAPTVHDVAPDNVAYEWATGDEESVDGILEEAPHTVSIDIGNQRIVQNPVEPRGSLVHYKPTTGKLTLHVTTQVPHILRRHLSEALGYPDNKIRVIVPDMGGGFGSRCIIYPEEVVLSWCSMFLERPLRWRGTRSENYMTDVHGRGYETSGHLALDEDGEILGYRVDAVSDLGAYASTFSAGIATAGINVLTGQYDIPEIYYDVTTVLTHTTPVDAYRGVMETEFIHMLERLMDMAARELDVDPAEIRRRNFVQPDQFPYETASGGHYDSGDYEPALERALEMAGYEDLRERQEALREEGRYLGVGISSWVEKSGFGCGGEIPSWEYSNIQFHESGEVSVFCGASNHGQGHETTFAQVAADLLGIPVKDVNVIENDTDQVREGVGSFASRCAPTAGGSLNEAADKIIEKGRTIAAHRLETAEADVEFEDGEYSVAGAPGRSISIQEVARHAIIGRTNVPEDVESGFEATSYFDPDDYTFPFGTHLAVAEVDPDTGEIDLLDYVAVDDCGVQINPMVVEGQIHGGVAQGVGQALYEGAEFDDNGQLITGSHMDYALPRAHHFPDMEVDSTETPTHRNPLGIKGVGESGAVAALPAAVNAVHDALEPFDVEPMTPPLTHQTVWRAVSEAREDR